MTTFTVVHIPSCETFFFKIWTKIEAEERKDMKLATIKPNDLALVINNTLIPLGETLEREGILPKGSTMLDLISNYDSIKAKLKPWPPKVAAPSLTRNYLSRRWNDLQRFGRRPAIISAAAKEWVTHAVEGPAANHRRRNFWRTFSSSPPQRLPDQKITF